MPGRRKVRKLVDVYGKEKEEDAKVQLKKKICAAPRRRGVSAAGALGFAPDLKHKRRAAMPTLCKKYCKNTTTCGGLHAKNQGLQKGTNKLGLHFQNNSKHEPNINLGIFYGQTR